ncbi:MAG: YjbQ family protein [Deltaproteobacteria bacterium]|nr:YjbQ family protein [Deltaproteobacteria bacterium]
METHCETIERKTSADTDIHDITSDVARVVSESGVSAGIVCVSVPGSTASITTIEHESGALHDLTQAIDRIAPRDMHYDHDARWGDGNGYSHVRAALLGPSMSVPIQDAHPVLGTWQQIVLCDFDNRPRTRQIVIQVVGK